MILEKTPDTIRIEVPVLYFEEDNLHFANVPALDITGYGESEKEAKESLNIMLMEFFKMRVPVN
jgi:hypothetical protein